MKAYKSMETYNVLVSGWVSDLGTKVLHNDYSLIFTRVSDICFYPVD